MIIIPSDQVTLGLTYARHLAHLGTCPPRSTLLIASSPYCGSANGDAINENGIAFSTRMLSEQGGATVVRRQNRGEQYPESIVV